MLEKTKEILEIICNDDLFKNFDIRFVGGTALSYRINHRLSEDLDFATLKLSPKEISNMIFKYGGKIIDHDKTMEDYVSNDGADINYSYMKFLLSGVKVEFFTPPFNLFEEEIWKNDKFTYYENSDLKVSSLETLIYMKTMAFWNRKKYRDLFDIYYVLEKEFITPKKFVNDYLKNHITSNTEHLYRNIQSKDLFYEKDNDEGINTLVKDPKPYDWYRNEIEKFIHKVLLDEIYEKDEELKSWIDFEDDINDCCIK